MPQALRLRPVRYRLLAEDFPDWEDASDMNIPDEVSDEWEEHFGAADGTKLGGWPKLLQAEIFWAPYNDHPANPAYVFQLDALPKGAFEFPADSVYYFGRGTGEHRNVWTFASQMY